MSALPDIRAAGVAGRKVLVRADLDVPVKDGIARFAPTVAGLLARGASVVVMTHLGRPNGEANPVYSVRPLADALARAIGREVVFVPDCVGAVAERAAEHLPHGKVLLLENLRFHRGEEENSRSFALRLSVNGDIYVNDAFCAAHSAHASTHAIAQVMPAFAGPALLGAMAALEGRSLPGIDILTTNARRLEDA